jgi:hypothetical protein
MRLACIESTAPGLDMQTFECMKCYTSERFTVAV